MKQLHLLHHFNKHGNWQVVSSHNTCDFYSAGAQFSSWLGYNYLQQVHGFPLSFHAYASPVPQPMMASFTSFPVHYSLIILRGSLCFLHNAQAH